MAILLANMGVPMLGVLMPFMVLTLIPVIAIEAYIAKRKLALTDRQAWSGTIGANLVSTILGIPVTWLLLVLLQAGTLGGASQGGPLKSAVLQPAWLIPFEGDIHWMLPVALLVLLVPCFYVSVWCERLMLRIAWHDVVAPEDIGPTVWAQNWASYAFLALVTCGWLVWAVLTGPVHYYS